MMNVYTIINRSAACFGTNNLDSINVGISNDANVDEVMMTIEQILKLDMILLRR